VLVQILVDDPGQPDQVSSARALAAEATEVHVPTIVLVETVWVLENSYKLHKSAIVRVLEHMTGNLVHRIGDEDLGVRDTGRRGQALRSRHYL